MRTYKKTDIILNEIDKVICDRCKNEIEPEFVETKEYFHIEHMGGYLSSWPGDMGKVEIDLCEYCAKVLFGNLVKVRNDYLDMNDGNIQFKD